MSCCDADASSISCLFVLFNCVTSMKLKLLALTAPIAIGATSIATLLLSLSPVMAQQNCRIVSRPHTERWWNGQRWRTSSTVVFEQVCDGISSGGSGGTTVQTPNGPVVFPTGYGIPAISTPDGGPLNVHAGPSFNTPIVGTIANGSALPLTGRIENNDWFETMDGNWIYKHHAR